MKNTNLEFEDLQPQAGIVVPLLLVGVFALLCLLVFYHWHAPPPPTATSSSVRAAAPGPAVPGDAVHDSPLLTRPGARSLATLASGNGNATDFLKLPFTTEIADGQPPQNHFYL